MHRKFPHNCSFSGHETFPFRSMWLKKAVDSVDSDAEVFNAEDAIVRLGVGKNMVRSIRHWGLSCGVLSETPSKTNRRDKILSSTELGRLLFKEDAWDPYLEDPATLWLLHWHLCTMRDRSTTWYWAFNHLPQPEFTRDQLVEWMLNYADENGGTRASQASMKRDVDCFLRTYVHSETSRGVSREDSLDCPLVELGLLQSFGSKHNYLLVRGVQPSLPTEIFAYALAEYIEDDDVETSTVSLEQLAYGPGAPGRVFALSEESLMVRFDRLAELTNEGIIFDETAGVRQILIRRKPDPFEILSAYYDDVATYTTVGGADA